MKIENEDLWSKIKDGTLKGLSIEGYFISKLEQMSTAIYSEEQILESLAEILKIK